MPTPDTGSPSLDPRDALSQNARAATRMDDRIVTSELVFIEFLNTFCDRGEALRAAAARFVRDIARNTAVLIIPHSSQLFQAALEL